MKIALLTGCSADGVDPLGSPRLRRMIRWIDWHWELHFADLYLSDNASSQERLTRLDRSKSTILTHQTRLTRGPGENEYPYCWRMLYDVKILIQLGYEKIIFLDSDCFITTARMLRHLQEIQSGWEAFWIDKYQFPSAEFHILCKDSFALFEDFTSRPYFEHVGKLMENALPFTHINPDFRVNRWGETRIPQDSSMDCYSQAPVDLPLRFYGS